MNHKLALRVVINFSWVEQPWISRVTKKEIQLLYLKKKYNSALLFSCFFTDHVLLLVHLIMLQSSALPTGSYNHTPSILHFHNPTFFLHLLLILTNCTSFGCWMLTCCGESPPPLFNIHKLFKLNSFSKKKMYKNRKKNSHQETTKH